eukprot:maker-scaffold_23-snap-gene-2.4-mRNA-1 protein AED:0.28 eAED:0.28 QI:200/1/1/1/1/1/2/59/369
MPTSTASAILITLLPLVVILGLWIGVIYDKKYANLMYKIQLIRSGFGHMLFSTDKKFPKKSKLPSTSKNNFKTNNKKRIIFIRHAESAWNEVFNKGFNLQEKNGKKSFPNRLFSALGLEFKMLTSLDSVFFDSPLSVFGTSQVKDLRGFVNEKLDDVITPNEKVCLVSSNLRRAISTATISFWDKLHAKPSDSSGKLAQIEQIKILSSLQEVTFNVDGVSLAKPYSSPQLAQDELNALEIKNFADFPEEIFECKDNVGNKVIRSSGMERMKEFCKWCFDPKQEEFDTILTSGHSLYFRFFFQFFLDAEGHEAQKFKMENAAVVSFVLEEGETVDSEGKKSIWYRIDPDSVEPLYLGFEKKKSKKEKKNE